MTGAAVVAAPAAAQHWPSFRGERASGRLDRDVRRHPEPLRRRDGIRTAEGLHHPRERRATGLLLLRVRHELRLHEDGHDGAVPAERASGDALHIGRRHRLDRGVGVHERPPVTVRGLEDAELDRQLQVR